MKKAALILDDERLLRAAATKSLREFVRQAFNIVVPAEPFMASWHTDAICDHLEALRRREIRNSLITMPPRHLKSTIVSVLFPPWCWLHDPTERFLTASYAADLATRDAVASRTLIESPWFQRWPARIDQTQNRQDRFSNTQRGYRLVTSVGGSTTGEGGDILVLDDPHNIREAESEATPTEAVLWHNRIWSTRGNNPATVCRVVVCQRSHHQDVAGDILAKGGYEHLNLPMEYEASRVVLTSKIGWKDPRREDGELLHSARFSAATVANLKTTLGSYAYAAQFQQRPTPLEGGMFKRTWWRFTDASPADVIAKAEFAKSQGTYVNACWSWTQTRPMILSGEIYATAALIGAATYAVLSRYGVDHPLAALLAFALALVIRGAAMLFHIRFGVMGEPIITAGRQPGS